MFTTRFVAACALALALSPLASIAAEPPKQSFGPPPEDIIAGWPEVSRDAAQFAIDKYGEPDTWSADMLHWYNAGPFAFMTVSSMPVPHEFPAYHEDVFEQAVFFEVPEDKVDELTLFDGSVKVDRTKGLLSAKCDKEEFNQLALNLAIDLINDEITVDDARQQYSEIAMAFKEDGTSHPYLTALSFGPQAMTVAADPDGPVSRVAAGEPMTTPGYNRSGSAVHGQDDRMSGTYKREGTRGMRSWHYDDCGYRVYSPDWDDDDYYARGMDADHTPYNPYTRWDSNLEKDASGYRVASRMGGDNAYSDGYLMNEGKSRVDQNWYGARHYGRGGYWDDDCCWHECCCW
jgi:hypothetical protein